MYLTILQQPIYLFIGFSVATTSSGSYGNFQLILVGGDPEYLHVWVEPRTHHRSDGRPPHMKATGAP